MKVKSKIVTRYTDKGRLKAVATVCLDGKFLVTGVRVVECQKGMTVFMPSREIRTGEYRDICFPITSELCKQVKDSVLEAYERPEDDDTTYGDDSEMEEKAELVGGFSFGATYQVDHSIEAKSGGQAKSPEQLKNMAQSEQSMQ